jgi:hypothetical protein
MNRFQRTLTAAIATLAVTASFSSAALANDGYYLNVSDYQSHAGEYKLGDWYEHKAWYAVRFYLPYNYDPKTDGVLQMGLRSTNKSPYNAIYVNPEYLPHEGQPCDSTHQDGLDPWLFDYLPYSEHDAPDHHSENIRSTYHRVIPGHLLKPGEENVILICARNRDGETYYDLDNFYFRDMVLHYRIAVYYGGNDER